MNDILDEIEFDPDKPQPTKAEPVRDPKRFDHERYALYPHDHPAVVCSIPQQTFGYGLNCQPIAGAGLELPSQERHIQTDVAIMPVFPHDESGRAKLFAFVTLGSEHHATYGLVIHREFLKEICKEMSGTLPEHKVHEVPFPVVGQPHDKDHVRVIVLTLKEESILPLIEACEKLGLFGLDHIVSVEPATVAATKVKPAVSLRENLNALLEHELRGFPISAGVEARLIDRIQRLFVKHGVIGAGITVTLLDDHRGTVIPSFSISLPESEEIVAKKLGLLKLS